MEIKVQQKIGKTQAVLYVVTSETKDAPYLKEAQSLGFKAEQGKVFAYPTPSEDVKRVVLVGVDKSLDAEKIRRAFSSATAALQASQITDCTVVAKEKEMEPILESILLSNYDFDKYKSKDNKTKKIESITLIGPASLQKVADRVKTICNGVIFVRELVNENSKNTTTTALADVAKKIASQHKMKLTVLDKEELKKKGLNLILAVGSASLQPPLLAIMEYNGDSGSKKRTALVGKGITFDTGGLNLKPTGYIETMKCDMSGAATVIGIMKVAAELGIKKNLIGVVPLAENMIGPGSYKPGDVFISYSGKSVEIQNTDAEGRLILGDAIAYTVKNYKPDTLINFATLTGAVEVALGDYMTGLFSNNRQLTQSLIKSGERTGELLWELPTHEDYREDIKGTIADIKNIGKSKASAGATEGAMFLKEFVEDTPWAHFDFAATAWLDSKRFYHSRGGTGISVRTIVDWLSNN